MNRKIHERVSEMLLYVALYMWRVTWRVSDLIKLNGMNKAATESRLNCRIDSYRSPCPVYQRVISIKSILR